MELRESSRLLMWYCDRDFMGSTLRAGTGRRHNYHYIKKGLCRNHNLSRDRDTMHAGSAFTSTASMDIPAGDLPQQSMSQSSLDSDDFDDETSIFLTAPKVITS